MRKSRTFEDVIAQIERRIADDGLTVGDRLPGERQLAEQLQVGRSSVREALRVLETLGVITSQAGRGPTRAPCSSPGPRARWPTC
ncbi:FadR/GntR family transcriptional regulator [Nonomuraea recticatena]|uniref:FadR/GntR family transcriptional regulator n=1 Tax=Nonomuraea recticatena TaxID=46178 RepID=UPI003621E6E4